MPEPLSSSARAGPAGGRRKERQNDERCDQAVGRRKKSVARVRLVPGTGSRTVNGKPIDVFFPRKTSVDGIVKPLEVTSTADRYDVHANVRGGGVSRTGGRGAGSASRARSCQVDESYRKPLKQAGLLTQ